MPSLVTPDILNENSPLRPVVMHLADVAKVAALKAAANLSDPKAFPLPDDPRSLERIFAARLATRPERSKQRAVKRAKEALAGSGKALLPALKHLAGVDMRSAKPIASQAAPALAALKLSAADLERFRLEDVASDGEGSSATVKSGSLQPGKTLSVRVHQVICACTTSDGSPHDEIKLGGVMIGPTGHTAIVAPFMVSDSFVDPGDEEEGDVSRVKYNPPRTFCKWTFENSGDHWPKTYTASLILCEEDEGGFVGFLTDVVQVIEETGIAVLEGAFGVLGMMIGALIELLFGWLINLWEDDEFYPITVHAVIDSPQHIFSSGSRTTNLKKYWVSEGSGKYWVYFDWQINP